MMPTATKWWTLKGRVSKQELRSRKVQKQVRFFFFRIFVWEVLANYLSRKPGVFNLNSNSQRVLKNYQYFMISNCNFGAFFQDKFSLCGITPNHSRFNL